MRPLLVLFLLCLTAPAFAADPAEMLKDPVLEHRAQALGRDLRCLVCQNESIEDSNADLARDLRVVVRERIQQGDSDEQVMSFVVDRYGDYVLLRPPFKGTTLVLWLGPVVLLLLGLVLVVVFYRRRQSEAASPPPPLSAEEQRRLDALLAAKEKDSHS